jgi:glutamate racemase
VSVERPIGVFDSGVGGLSVLREIRRALPAEDLLYVADSAFAPYGERSDATIEERSIAIANFLTRQSAKAIVVACNTATSVAVETLRARCTLPIVAIEPALKPAALVTKSGVIGVLATKHTLAGAKFAKLVQAHAGSARVVMRPCPGWVEQVEKGDLSSEATLAIVEQQVTPVTAQGADVLVLGCTHYPFLEPVIRAVAGPDVAIIDPAAAVARELRRRLEAAKLRAPSGHAGVERFWTSGSPESVQPVVARLWAGDVRVARMTDAGSGFSRSL